MRDFFNEEKLPGERDLPDVFIPESLEDDPEPLALLEAEIAAEERTGPTGPRSSTGKATSSMNRLSHGCRSEKTLLRDEDPEEFELVVNSWFDKYKPEDPDDIMFVQEAALQHWHYKRASKWLEEIEWRVPRDPYHSNGDHLKLLNNFTRYKTNRERSFFRFYNVLERQKRAGH